MVIIFLTMMLRTDMTTAAPYSPTSGTRGDIQCSVQSDQSFSFRSQCQDNGFLTVNRNKVFVQTSGLSQTHVEAEFEVEVCRRGSRRSRVPVVRYRHKKTSKYICFSRKGKVRVTTASHADRRGRQRLCMFRQLPVDRTFHRLQSVHNKKWHLAFNHRNSSLANIRGREPHRAALPRNGRYPYRENKCDFKFHAEEWNRGGEAWHGILDLIQQSKNNGNIVSKAAISDIAISSNEVEVDLSELDTVRGSERKISKAYKEKLLQQQVLNSRYQRKRKIRHFKHKKPRLSRRVKNGLKYGRKQPMKSQQAK